MRAIVFEQFGGPEVLQVQQVDEPHAGPGQLRIAVKAAAVNPLDFKIRNGWFEAFMPTTFPAVPGSEVAGVVDEVGAGVTEFAVGDEVVGWAQGGSYADYAIAGLVVKKPADVSWEQAVALPIAGETAARVLRELGVKEGETLLLHGAAGGVGSVAIQLAVALGVTVIGTASEANHDFVRSLGAIPILYGEGLVDRVKAVAPQGVDAVFDSAGQGALPDSIELRGGTDRVITIADMGAADLGVTFSMESSSPEVTTAGLIEQLQLAADGKLTLTVAKTFGLEDARTAQEISETGHIRGKLVLLP
ncbi:NADP-dependent oxidoreductase [Kribbella sp. NPDC056861]|uniref:NADP-dependent oxidoreductase n=1 Tax=Kribbella sp. NPDC056861 TaxID=3154857 RepID=UPI0034474CB6